MEVHVDRDAFIRGLQMAHNVVEPRQTLPVLANVLLEAQGDTLRMTATDLEASVRVTAPAKVVKPGPITISARKLMEIVKELPAAPLAIKVQENAWVALRCAGASFRLVGLTPEEFPAVGDGASTGWLTIDGKVLREMLGQTTFAISHDESRYALGGARDVRHRAAQGGAGGGPHRGLGRGGADRDQREPVHAQDAQRAADGAAHRGHVPALRAGGAPLASAPDHPVAPGTDRGAPTRVGSLRGAHEAGALPALSGDAQAHREQPRLRGSGGA